MDHRSKLPQDRFKRYLFPLPGESTRVGYYSNFWSNNGRVFDKICVGKSLFSRKDNHIQAQAL